MCAQTFLEASKLFTTVSLTERTRKIAILKNILSDLQRLLAVKVIM
jgi:hypothetical protein